MDFFSTSANHSRVPPEGLSIKYSGSHLADVTAEVTVFVFGFHVTLFCVVFISAIFEAFSRSLVKREAKSLHRGSTSTWRLFSQRSILQIN